MLFSDITRLQSISETHRATLIWYIYFFLLKVIWIFFFGSHWVILPIPRNWLLY